MSTSQNSPVVVVIGVGGMGKAIARRVGSGKTVLLADFNGDILDEAAEELRGDGFVVHTFVVDVSNTESVTELAARATNLGPVMHVVHTAGLSPVQAPVAAIIAVNLIGVALVLDAFAEVMSPGGAGVVIASMGGHLAQVSPDEEHALAVTPTAQLGALPFLAPSSLTDAVRAYGLSKRGNHVRMRAASVAWGMRGARVNTISPGVISTPMGQQELSGPSGDSMRAIVDGSPTKRLGTPDDIAAAAAFLLSPEASFITGTDLLVDGCAVASIRVAR